MLSSFKNIPQMLQKQILLRLAGSGLGLFCVIVILLSHGSWQLIFPGIVISFLFFFSASSLFFRCEEKRYVTIRGSCKGFECSSVRKRIKAVFVESDGRSIKVIHPYRGRPIKEGDPLIVYLADSASVYEMEGEFILCNILAFGKDCELTGNTL